MGQAKLRKEEIAKLKAKGPKQKGPGKAGLNSMMRTMMKKAMGGLLR